MKKKMLLFIPIIVAAAASFLASEKPDTLEAVSLKYSFDEKALEASSLFTDYSFPLIKNDFLSAFVSALMGLLILYLLYRCAALIIAKLGK